MGVFSHFPATRRKLLSSPEVEVRQGVEAGLTFCPGVIAEVPMLAFTCDVPGCKSRCQLAPEHSDMVCDALEKRGWTVETLPSGAASKHYCPAHSAGRHAESPKCGTHEQAT